MYCFAVVLGVGRTALTNRAWTLSFVLYSIAGTTNWFGGWSIAERSGKLTCFFDEATRPPTFMTARIGNPFGSLASRMLRASWQPFDKRCVSQKMSTYTLLMEGGWWLCRGCLVQVTRQHSKKDQWALDDMVTHTEAKQTVDGRWDQSLKLSPLQLLAGLDCGICRPRACPRGRPEIQPRAFCPNQGCFCSDPTSAVVLCETIGIQETIPDDVQMFVDVSAFCKQLYLKDAPGRPKHSWFVYWRCQVGISVLLAFGRCHYVSVMETWKACKLSNIATSRDEFT